MNTITKTIATLSIAISAMAGAAQAQDVPTRNVYVGNYDLTTAAGVAKARQSIRMAARSVCGLNEHEGLSAAKAKQTCFRHAMEVASAQIDAKVAIATSQKAALSVR